MTVGAVRGDLSKESCWSRLRKSTSEKMATMPPRNEKKKAGASKAKMAPKVAAPRAASSPLDQPKGRVVEGVPPPGSSAGSRSPAATDSIAAALTTNTASRIVTRSMAAAATRALPSATTFRDVPTAAAREDHTAPSQHQ